jgi:hypothetical protein
MGEGSSCAICGICGICRCGGGGIAIDDVGHDACCMYLIGGGTGGGMFITGNGGAGDGVAGRRKGSDPANAPGDMGAARRRWGEMPTGEKEAIPSLGRLVDADEWVAALGLLSTSTLGVDASCAAARMEDCMLLPRRSWLPRLP